MLDKMRQGNPMMLPLLIVSRRWLFATVMVFLAMVVMIRLGFWQLDRLQQRRAFNQRVLAQIHQPELELQKDTLKFDLYNMEYRHVMAEGKFDFQHEVAIRNQVHENEWGVYLLTPLIIEGTDTAILVNRGWINGADYLSGDWSKYAQSGKVMVRGILRRSQSKPDFGQRSDPIPDQEGEVITSWNFVNVEAISKQISYPVVAGVYLQMSGETVSPNLPIPAEVEVEITEGPHLSYAIQWFMFSAIFGIGYLFYVNRKVKTDD